MPVTRLVFPSAFATIGAVARFAGGPRIAVTNGGRGQGGVAPGAPCGMGIAIPQTDWDDHAGDLARCLLIFVSPAVMSHLCPPVLSCRGG
jgi:hypothetical protein